MADENENPAEAEFEVKVSTLTGPMVEREIAAEVVGALAQCIARPWVIRPETLDVLRGALEGRLALPAAG